MLKRINQCDIYVGLWCIYMLQEVLYPHGIINQSLQLIMLLWSMTAVCRYMVESTEYSYSSILKATFLLIVMYVIYGVINMMFGETMFIGRYVYLQISLNSLAPIFLFYNFTMNGQLTRDRIRIYLPILILTCILLYYKTEREAILEMNNEEVTNNAGYFFVSLIPFLFFYAKKPILQYLFMGIILLYVVMGMKRGAILIGVISTIVFLYANINNSSKWTKVLTIMLTISIIVGTSVYIGYMMDNSDYFMVRVEQTLEGDTSNRDIIYGSLWNSLLSEQSPLNFYLGRGANSTLRVIGSFAHQDWLETFCNNGLLGVFILFSFFYTFGKNAWKSRHSFSGMMLYSFVSLFIIIFGKTLFSMSIQDLGVAESMLIGYFAYWVEQEDDELEEFEV